MFKKPTARALVLAGICLLAIAPFFWYGNPSGHDFEFHVYSWMDVVGQWKHGLAFPRWAVLANWGYGDPRFLFYPPASWTIGAALGSILPWNVVPGVYCWGALTLAGLSMYRLARQWLRKKDAMFAAMFYALNPYHLLIVYWRSAFAELLAAAVIPLVVLYLVRLNNASLEQQTMVAEGDFESKGGAAPREFAASAVGLSLALAAAWLTNLPAAVMIHYSVAAFAVFFALRLFVRERGSPHAAWVRKLWRPLLATAGAIVIGMGLVGFYLLPAIYEQRWVNISDVLSPGVRPQDNYLFTTINDPDHNRFNVLVSILASAEILAFCLAVAQSRIYRARRIRSALAGPVPGTAIKSASTGWLLFSVWGLGCAFLMLSRSNALWQHLPKLRYVQLPFRWLLCLNAALAMLLAMATKRWFPRLLVCGLLLLTLLTAGHLTQPPWWDTAADIREMSDFIEDGTGYEGTGEYVPAGADASELKKDLARVSDESGHAVPGKIIEWQAERIHFTVPSKKRMNIVVKLLNYPAWEVSVNGRVVQSASTEATGLMSFPISSGENDVQIRFRRSNDRIIGMTVSLISLLIVAGAWISPRILKVRKKFNRAEAGRADIDFVKPHTVLVATSNAGKVRDFVGAAATHGVAVATLPNFDLLELVVEDGKTFEENARKKAEAYSKAAPQELVIADDSGLEIDALNGAPGIYSARYASEEPHVANADHDDDANNARVLREMAAVPSAKRTARFVCVIAAARDGQTMQTFKGTVEGFILEAPRGDNGFGYDPLFYFPQIGKTLAELTPEKKAQFSHRGEAFRAFLHWYRQTSAVEPH